MVTLPPNPPAPSTPPAPVTPATRPEHNILTDVAVQIPAPYYDLLLSMVAHGYTIRRIQQIALTQGWPLIPSPKAIVAIHNDPTLASQLSETTRRNSQAVLTWGLARKEERIRRLSQLAIQYERHLGVGEYEDSPPEPLPAQPPLQPLQQLTRPDGTVVTLPTDAPVGAPTRSARSNPIGPDNTTVGGINLRIAKEYRATLEQIQKEMEPLGLKIKVSPDDEWFQLIQELRSPKTQQPQQVQTHKALPPSSTDSNSPKASTQSKKRSSTTQGGSSSSQVVNGQAKVLPPQPT